MTWPRQRGYPLKGMRGCRSRDRCRPLERLARETGPRRANRRFRRALRPMSWPRLDDKSTGRENVSLVEPLRRGGREGEEEGEIFRRSSSIHSARGHLGPRSARLAPFLLLSSFLIPLYFASFFFCLDRNRVSTSDREFSLRLVETTNDRSLTRRVDTIDLGWSCSCSIGNR